MVKYPGDRRTLIYILQYLADEEYQRELWIDRIRQFDPNVDFYHLTLEIVHFTFGDMSLEIHPEGAIGAILKDEVELDAIKAVVDALRKCIDALRDAPDEEYIEYPGWGEVVFSARRALEVIGASPKVVLDENDKPVFPSK